MKNKLTPEQYVKRAIIDRAKDFFEEIKIAEDITPEGIEAAYERLDEEYCRHSAARKQYLRSQISTLKRKDAASLSAFSWFRTS